MNKKIIVVAAILCFVSILGFGSQPIVLAWQDPTALPPAGGGSFVIESGSPANMIYIKADGNVGIGTTTPGMKLDVGTGANDLIRSYGGFTGNAAANIGGTGAAAYFPNGLWSNGPTAWIYGSVTFNGALAGATSLSVTGNVGIGTTSPGAKLHVAAGANRTLHAPDASSYSTLHLVTLGRSGAGYGTIGDGYRTTTTAGVYNYDRSDYATQIDFSSGNINLKTAPSGTAGNATTFTNRMSILNTGNVGIGTTSPATKLDVQMATNVHFGMRTGELNALYSQLNAYTDAGAANTGMELKASDFHWNIGNAEKVTILSSGNVGIGTTAPAAKLAINGGLHVGGDSDPGDNNALIDGTLTVTGNANTCNLVAYTSGSGTVSCPAGFYTWSGVGLTSGYMLCCKVSNPI